MTKPVILAVGTCVSEKSLQGLQAQPELAQAFEFAFFNHNSSDRTEDPISPDLLSRTVLSIQDIGPWQAETLLNEAERLHLNPDAVQISLPALHFNSMWPLLSTDPRNKPLPELRWGRYPNPWTDRLALEMVETYPTVEERVAAYLAKDVTQIMNLDRFHEMQLVNMAMREEGYDVKVGAYLAARFRDERLFFVHHHPSSRMFSYMLSQILMSPKFRHVYRKNLGSLTRNLTEWCEVAQIFADEQLPLHPQVARALDLRWWSEDMAYRLSGRDWTFLEWITYYMTEDLPQT